MVLYGTLSALAHPEPYVTFAGKFLRGLGRMGGSGVRRSTRLAIRISGACNSSAPIQSVGRLFPLVIGASCGLALRLVITMRFLPDGPWLYAYGVLISSAAMGGFAASFTIRIARQH